LEYGAACPVGRLRLRSLNKVILMDGATLMDLMMRHNAQV
jgi:hypothetical protein